MNKDLISREALKDRLAKHQSILDFEWDNSNLIASIIDSAPSVEGLQGKWIKVIDYSDEYEKRWHYECSECKNAPYYGDDICTLHFCPNCGASMKGEVS